MTFQQSFSSTVYNECSIEQLITSTPREAKERKIAQWNAAKLRQNAFSPEQINILTIRWQEQDMCNIFSTKLAHTTPSAPQNDNPAEDKPEDVCMTTWSYCEMLHRAVTINHTTPIEKVKGVLTQRRIFQCAVHVDHPTKDRKNTAFAMKHKQGERRTHDWAKHSDDLTNWVEEYGARSEKVKE